MTDTITRVLLTVATIWGITATVTFLWERFDQIRARRTTAADPWSCPQLCGQEHGYWCQHLAPEVRCPAVNERGDQCIQCRGHNTDDATWPGFAIGHHHAPHHSDRSTSS